MKHSVANGGGVRVREHSAAGASMAKVDNSTAEAMFTIPEHWILKCPKHLPNARMQWRRRRLAAF